MVTRKKWMLVVIAGALAGAGAVLAQSDANPNQQPANPSQQAQDPNATDTGQQTTMTGQLTTIHAFVTGHNDNPQANAADNNTNNPNNTNNNANNDAANPNATPAPGSTDTNASGHMHHDWLLNNPLCLVDTNGQCVILGQSKWARNQDTTGANGANDSVNPGIANNNPNAGQTQLSEQNTINNNGSRTTNRLYQARPWINQQVNITGKLYTRGGVRYLDVDTLSPAGTASLPTHSPLSQATH